MYNIALRRQDEIINEVLRHAYHEKSGKISWIVFMVISLGKSYNMISPRNFRNWILGSVGESVRPVVCPSVCNMLLSGLAHPFLLIFFMKLGFNKHKKVTQSLFEENYCYAQSGVNGGFFDLKATAFNFFLNLYIRFFWNYPWC